MEWMEYLVIAIFVVTESLLPRNGYRFFRPGVFEDIFYLVMIAMIIPRLHNYFPWGFNWIREAAPLDVSSLTFAGQFVLCLILGDFLRFVVHLAMHRIPFMWKTHKLHHSTTELSTLSAYRTGYFEEIWLILFILSPMHLFKFDFEVITAVFTLFSVHGYFLHSNLNIRFPRWLGFIACPHFHQWHHANEEIIHGGQNYGATFTFWDKALSMYIFPENSPRSFGLYHQEVMKGNFLRRFFYPLFK